MASAFEIYLRTGRRVATELELETKFNPWHDPDDGRFTKGADNRMSEDKFDILSALLNEIGSEIAEIVGGDPAGTYLYAEAGEGWIGSSLFKDEGSAIRYFDTTDVLDVSCSNFV